MENAEKTVGQLALEVNALQDKRAELEELLKEVKAQYRTAEAALFERMEHEDMESVRAAGYTFTRKDTPHYSVNADNQTDLYRALRKEGYGSLIRETVHAGTLNAFIREQVDGNGGAMPEYMDGLVDVYWSKDISRRRF